MADRSVEELTRDVAFFEADAVIATGQRTGNAATLDEITSIGSSSSLSLLVGSGVTPDNIATILPHVDGVIVASSLKRDGDWWNEVQVQQVKSLVEASRRSLL